MAAQLWSMDTWYKALLRRLTNCEGSGQATGCSRGFAFCLKSKLLSNTVRSRGRERLCGHDVMDDLMVPAHRGKEGGTERGPSSISHKVSVGSASKHLGEARVQHSKRAVFTDRGQEGDTVWGERQPSDTLGVHN